MKIKIVKRKASNGKQEKALYLDGQFQAAWDISVKDMDTIIPYALDRAFKLGERHRADKVRELLSLVT